MATLWESVDEPILRWIASLPSSFEMEVHHLELRKPVPFTPIAGLTSRDAHEGLARLQSHGLVGGVEHSMNNSTAWSKLRVTARGWIVLGEWPDLDRVATAASIHKLLRALADEAPDDDRAALIRAAGVVSRTADEVVRGVASDIAKTAGSEAVDD